MYGIAQSNQWCPGLEPGNRDEGQDLIIWLRGESGGLSDEARARTPAEALAVIENLRAKVSSLAVKLSVDLYSADHRFLYELIQNADDNFYNKALAKGDLPRLELTLLNDKIVIDCNEDGFRRKDVEAICDVAKSTKDKDIVQGYIGEKGIGFKSVFKVANRVHVKSEPYSFSFLYKRFSREGGMGMITPIPEGYSSMPETGSQIVLSDIDDSNAESLRKEFENIPNALLLFLRKLKILIVRYIKDAEIFETKYSKCQDSAQRFQRIEIATSRYPTHEQTDTVRLTTPSNVLRFFVAEGKASDLPKDEARKTSKGEYITSSTVILAFPVDQADEPVIEEQFTFAFLPLRKFGFTFLIQADFITQSSREDVIHSSKRNRALLSQIVDVFVDATLNLCKHSTLQYKWMRYLPQPSISSDFWKDLRPELIRHLIPLPIVKSWTLGQFLPSKRLGLVPPKMRDNTGQPLLDDSSYETYLSPMYHLQDWARLQDLGTNVINHEAFLAIFRQHLLKDRGHCRWQDLESSIAWQDKMSTILLEICRASMARKFEVQSMNIVPLRSGLWVSTKGKKVYMPYSGSIPIPVDLDFQLLEPQALKSNSRKELYREIGVLDCEPSDVISAIFYRHHGSLPAKTVGDAISHTVYTFWNHDNGKPVWIKLINQKDNFMRHCSKIYFREPDNPLGPQQLFAPGTYDGKQAPGYEVNFIHDLYLPKVAEEARRWGKTWREWLSTAFYIQSIPKLTFEKDLTPEFKYILSHRSDILVALLKEHQKVYTPVGKDVVQNFSNAQVPIQNRRIAALEETYLPTTELLRKAEQMKVADMPFLCLNANVSVEEQKNWAFLKQFGVEMDVTTRFFVQCLVNTVKSSTNHIESSKSVFDIYRAIQDNYKQSEQDKVKPCLNLACIYISNPERSPSWARHDACVWLGPKWLKCKHVLYDIAEYSQLEHFCKHIMKIPNASWQDSLQELGEMKDKQVSDFSKVCKIYESLWLEFRQDSNHGAVLREQFESRKLVYTEKDGWIAPSACIWASSRVQITGKVSIGSLYKSLKEFFQNTLNVDAPSIAMHVQTLKSLQGQHADAGRLKETMEHISLMGPLQDSLKSEVNGLNIFPVRLANGLRLLAMSSVGFVINDRPLYHKAFEGKVMILDFTMEEVRTIHSFLIACGLKARFMSECVEESTAVEDATISMRLTERLRSYAYAFTRCAKHFNSSRTSEEHEEIFANLQTLSVYRSDKITRTLTIRQYPDTITIPQDQADLHFDASCDDHLRIYVPTKKHAFHRCWPQQIYPKFKSWLGISDRSADAILLTIFTKGDKLQAIDEALEWEGIISIEGVHKPERSDQSSSEDEDSEAEQSGSRFPASSLEVTVADQGTQRSSPSIPILATPSSSSPRRDSPVTPLLAPQSEATPAFATSPPTSGHHSYPRVNTPQLPTEEDLYQRTQRTALRTVLENVIQAARRNRIPDLWATEESQTNVFASADLLQAAFGPTVINGFRNVARDRKVGAAGELYAFETLKSLDLPGFDISNWRSTIRHEVRAHESYRDLTVWSGFETSDIVYHDLLGNLTAELANKGYLSRSSMSHQPKYYLEIKTTTENWNEPFYVSSAQYERMKRAKLLPNVKAAEVYVIIRVFNLGRGNGIQCAIYVDPYSAQENNDLVFRSEKWVVKPERMPSVILQRVDE